MTATATETTPRVTTLAADALDRLAQLGREHSLPPVPEEFSRVRALLERREFNVAVLGEASCGKSSFINALISFIVIAA